MLDDDIVMLNMFVLLYADDTIVLAENAYKLQKALDAVDESFWVDNNNWVDNNPSYSPTSHTSTQLPTIQQRPPF